MANLYNILYGKPAIEARDMFTSLEQLATELVGSGLLRIDADEAANFVRYATNEEAIFFSHRELHDPKLLPRAKRKISDATIAALKKTFKTITPIAPELEQKIARLIVQAAHPAIIKLLLLEEVEVFASFSYNVSDLMAMHEYEHFFGTGGLQAFDSHRAKIYISCAGNPFSNVEEHRQFAYNALARFMIIGAQEIAHYSDLARSKKGAVIGRFSAQRHCLDSRHADFAWLNKTAETLYALGLRKAAKVEQSVSFFEKHRKNSLKHLFTIFHSFLLNKILRFRATGKGIAIAKYYSARWLAIMLSDMKFNLDPQGYEHPNRQLEELTKSAEALARVSQQELKWGRKTVKFLYPNLHKIYYSEVIPSVIHTLETKSGQKFVMRYKKLGWVARTFKKNK